MIKVNKLFSQVNEAAFWKFGETCHQGGTALYSENTGPNREVDYVGHLPAKN